MYARVLLIGTLLLATLGWAGHVNAEGRCPPGSYPVGSETGVLGCAPIPGGGSGEYAPSSVGSSKRVPQWIAYARSPDGLVLGWSVFQHKQKGANKQALKACNARSGQKCEIVASFTGKCSTALRRNDTAQLEVVLRDFAETSNLNSEEETRICPNGCQRITSDCARDFHAGVGGPDRGPNWFP
ncbi:DUF4189 domain-containing protein [Stenotrophomonas indicatrix]|uniref:DUF4189 domain-containing protein n=1 Tax=Stenotrophomonas lactitubi TaxID=2045214 RepID=UPI001DCC3F4B|nr:DUF4189 domain-containing protein [Stenotrophomonas lactitubi]CAH0227248.1 hypothetical protein SRABI35_02367 [Stenotrophomonas lactitubi]